METPPPYPGAPPWAKVLGAAALLVILVVVVVHLLGGGFRHHGAPPVTAPQGDVAPGR